jgi:phage baseplate assembly protein W
MAVNAKTQLLGSGPAYPLRAASSGLPDFELAEGVAAVESAFGFLLRTAPMDLVHDPALGINMTRLKHRHVDADTERSVRDSVASSLSDGEPRVLNVEADITRRPSENRLDVLVSYELIQAQVPENLVLNPPETHEDALNITE